MSSNENTWKDSLVGLFSLSPTLGIICVNRNVHLVMQHPSLGSMTKGPTDRSETLIPMLKPGQKPSIYICLSPVKTADFMHPKWEGCIVINSLIFVVVSKNILYCLNLGKNYLSAKPTSNKNDGLYQKTTYKHIHWPNRLWKNSPCFRVDWKIYKKHFDYIAIICPTVQENDTYHAKEWIKNGDNNWLVDPKDNLYQWIKTFSELLQFFEVLFTIDDIIANESRDKRRQPLLE